MLRVAFQARETKVKATIKEPGGVPVMVARTQHLLGETAIKDLVRIRVDGQAKVKAPTEALVDQVRVPTKVPGEAKIRVKETLEFHRVAGGTGERR